MKAIRNVLDYLMMGGVNYVFGIPAGSVNAFFDELVDVSEIEPVIAKHEGAAAYMAAAYARYTNQLAVCVASSGPGSTNLISGVANAYREQLPILFITGSVPKKTVGLNASQEFNATPLFAEVTKYSVTVNQPEDLLNELHRAVTIALSDIPGPVHIAIPIDVQLSKVEPSRLPIFPERSKTLPEPMEIKQVAQMLYSHRNGFIFVGQGARDSIFEVLQLAELLQWPIVTTPQAKGLIADSHPLYQGVYGFAGQQSASDLIEDETRKLIIVIGSSLGETATSNWNENLTKNRFFIHLDRDETIFNRAYKANITVKGDASTSLQQLFHELENFVNIRLKLPLEAFQPSAPKDQSYNTQNVLLRLQEYLPRSTRYTIDIGEFMSYVIHYMRTLEPNTFDINVHFGAMGMGIGSAIGIQLADPTKQVVSITGDGCFFMHGMEILTAKEYNLPILFVVMNNARLGMVYHGHTLQYNRAHTRFEQEASNISLMATALGIPSLKVDDLSDLTKEEINRLTANGPSLLEVALVDNNIPPMGDRVKFLSSFQE